MPAVLVAQLSLTRYYGERMSCAIRVKRIFAGAEGELLGRCCRKNLQRHTSISFLFVEKGKTGIRAVSGGKSLEEHDLERTQYDSHKQRTQQ